uniref:Uncharacterized protein n=1 Tax=Avena sativa TaxID=4498 RepID=A0ACD5XGL0_AVESA
MPLLDHVMHQMSTSMIPACYRVIVCWWVVLLLSCTVATSHGQPPLISRLAKDPATSLYTITVKADKSPLVVDLAGSLVWSTCPSSPKHGTVPCESTTCDTAKQQGPAAGCRYVDGGRFWENRKPGSSWCACTAHPLNPVTRECSTGDLTSVAMSTNTTTNGTMDLRPEEPFAVVGACAPARLLRSLPASATGIAGFSRQPLSLPSQLAGQRGFGKNFALCLPVFATFGDTPVYMPLPSSPGLVDYRTNIPYTPLLSNAGGHYYIPVKGISVSWNGVHVTAQLPAGVLDLDSRTGRGGVALSTATPYGTMRPDVFEAFAKAFDDVITRKGNVPYRWLPVERVVPAVKPFELCYRGSFTRLRRPSAYDLPYITLELGEGATWNWTLYTDNYMVEVDRAMCVGILPTAMDSKPAVVLGGRQLENNLLVFDLDNQRLGFSQLLDFRLTSCSSSKFSRN